ncbi:TPA: LOW QUALITY PROTEIN: hypothetical protein N0F65_006053 [Lagenidium giganteum]|uniref:Reverse transcriptase n=1 Tax=Lagenidium giganteum TaxID=4803 RepID=A0AAV2YGQ5_9STRA|nr:TPA: LOW QUALITY PROTEIN: hypothetical protein N0F65_006053 [Lagenidium giganteum]
MVRPWDRHQRRDEDTPAGIKHLHKLVTTFLDWTNLRANPDKCTSLAIQPDPARRTKLTSIDLGLHLDGDPIPSLNHSADYKYLGVPDGFNHVSKRYSLTPTLLEMKRQCAQLLRSGLAPWQIIRSIKTYVYSQDFLPHVRAFAIQLKTVDDFLRKGLRHLLRLPSNTTTQLFYAPTSAGGLGFIPLAELSAATQVAHAWKMLHSADPTVQAIAKTQVIQAIPKRYTLDVHHWNTREDELIETCLNSELHRSPFATPKRSHSDIDSLWISVQAYLRQLNLKFITTPALGDTPEQALQLLLPPLNRAVTTKNILHELSKLTAKNGADKRQRQRNNDRCRHPPCTRSETLTHVLNHCPNNNDAIRSRHDQALALIKLATQKATQRNTSEDTQLLIDSTVQGFEAQPCRPDIQLYNHTTKEAAIIDLAITYEDQPTNDPASSSLYASRIRKQTKYSEIKRHLERSGWTVYLDGIVYGSLGAVLQTNSTIYTKHLGLLKREARDLDRKIVTKTIQSSYRIWRQHRQTSHHHREAQISSTAQHVEPSTRPSTR